MNRTIWIARAVAALILVIFLVLMTNLYTKLKQLQHYRRPAATRPSSK